MTAKPIHYKIIDHTADLGIRICGTDLAGLFENACNSLTDLFLKIKASGDSSSVRMTVRSMDLEDLMVRWLGEILYLFEGENTVVISSRISKISHKQLDATLETVIFDPLIHEIIREIKAVTYHDIQVSEKNGTWEALVVLDL